MVGRSAAKSVTTRQRKIAKMEPHSSSSSRPKRFPLFYDRGPDGVPHAVGRDGEKRSLITVGSRFTARRMLGDYVAHIYTDGR